MKECPKCKANNNDNAYSCYNCGNSFNEVKLINENNEHKMCIHCKTEEFENPKSKLCNKCSSKKSCNTALYVVLAIMLYYSLSMFSTFTGFFYVTASIPFFELLLLSLLIFIAVKLSGVVYSHPKNKDSITIYNIIAIIAIIILDILPWIIFY